MKTCNKCHIEKEESCFCKDKKNHDGLNYTCKTCCLNYQKKYQRENKEQILLKQRNRQKGAESKEKAKIYYKEWSSKNKDRVIGYRKKAKRYESQRRKTIEAIEYNKKDAIERYHRGLKQKYKLERDAFSDRYIKRLLIISGLSLEAINNNPIEVELKRVQLKTFRLLKNQLKCSQKSTTRKKPFRLSMKTLRVC